MSDVGESSEGSGSVAVIGAGTMGAGIAQLCAEAGYRTVLIDTSAETAALGRERVAAFMAEGVRRGKVTESEVARTLAAIETSGDLRDARDAEFVIEAVVENADVKLEVLREVSSLSPTSVIATNTSAVPIATLATGVEYPERFGGLHFFNPPQLMKLVEIVPAIGTSADTTTSLQALVSRIGKKGVVVRDRPGFLVNSLLMPYLNQVVAEFDDGLATAEDLDTAVELGLGHPMGPLKLLDLIGLDVHLHATEAAYRESYDIRFAPPALLRRMVSAGRLGDKARGGFHREEEKI
jgi:3-hydroxybutyryl-CoA dehydrogenase